MSRLTTVGLVAGIIIVLAAIAMALAIVAAGPTAPPRHRTPLPALEA